MNTFTIYQNNSMLFSRICSSSPSLEEKSIVLAVLEKCKFSNLEYHIDIIYGSNHRKLQGVLYSADEFIQYLLDLCKDRVKYGDVLYLN